MNSNAKNKMNLELKNSENLEQFLAVLLKYYDAKNCELGAITNKSLCIGIDKLISLTRCKAKKEFL